MADAWKKLLAYFLVPKPKDVGRRPLALATAGRGSGSARSPQLEAKYCGLIVADVTVEGGDSTETVA